MHAMVAQTRFSTHLTGLSLKRGMADLPSLSCRISQFTKRDLPDLQVALGAFASLSARTHQSLCSLSDPRLLTISTTFISPTLVRMKSYLVDSEYPTVDGQNSITIYLNALRQCWDTFDRKYTKRFGTKVPKYHDFDYFCFHTPYSKMVQKSFFELLKHDILTQANKSDCSYPKDLCAKIQEAKGNDRAVQ